MMSMALRDSLSKMVHLTCEDLNSPSAGLIDSLWARRECANTLACLSPFRNTATGKYRGKPRIVVTLAVEGFLVRQV